MRRISTLAAAAAASLALVGTSAFVAPASAGFDKSVSAKKSDRTAFAYKSAAYGSRVRGGSVPAASGTNSYQAIGCTNAVGVDKTNDMASVEIPGLGTAKGVTTRNWTERRNGVHSSYSMHDIAKVVSARAASASSRSRA